MTHRRQDQSDPMAPDGLRSSGPVSRRGRAAWGEASAGGRETALRSAERVSRAAVQFKRERDSGDVEGIHESAARGVRGTGGKLPYFEQIQKSFGKHDISGIRAFVGGDAALANREMGSRGYATGGAVAFAQAPDLHTAAHEAAHYVQQSRGEVSLADGVGQVGDRYEHQADAVADAVVSGRCAESLLGGIERNHSNTSDGALQMKRLKPHQLKFVAKQKAAIRHMLKEIFHQYESGVQAGALAFVESVRGSVKKTTRVADPDYAGVATGVLSVVAAALAPVTGGASLAAVGIGLLVGGASAVKAGGRQKKVTSDRLSLAQWAVRVQNEGRKLVDDAKKSPALLLSIDTFIRKQALAKTSSTCNAQNIIDCLVNGGGFPPTLFRTVMTKDARGRRVPQPQVKGPVAMAYMRDLIVKEAKRRVAAIIAKQKAAEAQKRVDTLKEAKGNRLNNMFDLAGRKGLL